MLCLSGCPPSCEACDSWRHASGQFAEHARRPLNYDLALDLELLHAINTRSPSPADFQLDQRNGLARVSFVTHKFEIGPVYCSRQTSPKEKVHVIGFVGPTGSGKSFLASFFCGDEPGSYPLHLDDSLAQTDLWQSFLSTSIDLHFYPAEPDFAPVRTRHASWGSTFVLDCEGFGAATHSSQAQLAGHVQHHNIPQADLDDYLARYDAQRRAYREFVYPPLLYAASDVLVYVCTHRQAELSTLVSKLINDATTSRAQVTNVLIKPSLVIVFNDQTRTAWPSVAEDTAAFFRLRESAQLLSFYTEIRVVFLPSKTNEARFVVQMRRFKAVVLELLEGLHPLRQSMPGQTMFSSSATWFRVFNAMVHECARDPTHVTLDLYNLTFSLTRMSDSISANVLKFFFFWNECLARKPQYWSGGVSRTQLADPPFSPRSRDLLHRLSCFVRAARATQERLITALLLEGNRSGRIIRSDTLIPRAWIDVIDEVTAGIQAAAPCLASTCELSPDGERLAHTVICGTVRSQHEEGAGALHRTPETHLGRVLGLFPSRLRNVEWPGEFAWGSGRLEPVLSFKRDTVERLSSILASLLKSSTLLYSYEEAAARSPARQAAAAASLGSIGGSGGVHEASPARVLFGDAAPAAAAAAQAGSPAAPAPVRLFVMSPQLADLEFADPNILAAPGLSLATLDTSTFRERCTSVAAKTDRYVRRCGVVSCVFNVPLSRFPSCC